MREYGGRVFKCFLFRAASALPSSLNDFVIGRTNEGIGSRDMGIMTIDDFQFWSRQLSEKEIRENGNLHYIFLLKTFEHSFSVM